MAETNTSAGSPRFPMDSEIVAAVLLSIAALASSYAGFQEALWDGEQAGYYTRSSQDRSSAGRAETVAVQLDTVDAMVFSQWLNAAAAGQTELQNYYRNRFRPPFRAQFERWLAMRPRFNPSAPATPFEMPGYRASTREAAGRLSKLAQSELELGQDANDVSDRYGRATLVLAVSLFLGGIVQTFKRARPRTILLALSAVTLLVGIWEVLALPAIRLT